MKKIDPIQHTIDKKHSQMLECFHNNETVRIPELIQKKNDIKQQFSSINSDQIELRMELKDQISAINDKIKKYNNNILNKTFTFRWKKQKCLIYE